MHGFKFANATRAACYLVKVALRAMGCGLAALGGIALMVG